MNLVHTFRLRSSQTLRAWRFYLKDEKETRTLFSMHGFQSSSAQELAVSDLPYTRLRRRKPGREHMGTFLMPDKQ